MADPRFTGKIKSWGGQFGFIKPDPGQACGKKDHFANANHVEWQGEGDVVLKPGQEVEFSAKNGAASKISQIGGSAFIAPAKPATPPKPKRTTGTVKVWKSGFGFVKVDPGQAQSDEQDVFVHQNELQMEGFRTLGVGQKIEFDVFHADDGKLQGKFVTGINGGELVAPPPPEEKPPAAPGVRITGVIKKWGNGWGFIDGKTLSTGPGQDVFCHQKELQMDGYRELHVGQSVEFEIGSKPDGRSQAVNVTIAQGGGGGGGFGMGGGGGFGQQQQGYGNQFGGQQGGGYGQGPGGGGFGQGPPQGGPPQGGGYGQPPPQGGGYGQQNPPSPMGAPGGYGQPMQQQPPPQQYNGQPQHNGAPPQAAPPAQGGANVYSGAQSYEDKMKIYNDQMAVYHQQLAAYNQQMAAQGQPQIPAPAGAGGAPGGAPGGYPAQQGAGYPAAGAPAPQGGGYGQQAPAPASPQSGYPPQQGYNGAGQQASPGGAYPPQQGYGGGAPPPNAQQNYGAPPQQGYGGQPQGYGGGMQNGAPPGYGSQPPAHSQQRMAPY